jgi:hypothetical protein
MEKHPAREQEKKKEKDGSRNKIVFIRKKEEE